MDELPDTSEDGNFDRDSLSNESISRDSLVNDTEVKHAEEDIPPPRKGSYTIEVSPELSESIRNCKLRQPLFIKIDNYRNSYASEKSSDLDMKTGSNISQKQMMTQSMYERPWISSKRNNSINSAINKQREEKIRLAKEEQMKKQQLKKLGLNATQKQTDIARKRKEVEIQRKTEEKRLKTLERQRIVEERKLRLAQAEEARKNRILRKMTNQDEKHTVSHATNNMMTMSCYGALGSAKIRPGNKEVVKDRFISKRPLSSTGKVIGFGSSSPRSICENPAKPTLKHPPKISEYLMERSQILSRPTSSRISDRMTTSVFVPNQPVFSNRTFARQGSLKEKKLITSPLPDEASKNRSLKRSKVNHIKKDVPDGKCSSFSPPTRSSSRKTNSAQSNSISNTLPKTIRERPSSAKPVQHNVLPERGMVQSKSSTFPKTKTVRHLSKSKVDAHLDSDSIEDDGVTLTESINHPRSVTSSLISQIKSEVNRTDLSSADSLDAENVRERVHEVKIDDKTHPTKPENTNPKDNVSSRGLPTKDLSEAEYRARIMENRRLMREKREKEREQLMKAERERRHADEASVREVLELEKNRLISLEEQHLTTSNDDVTEDQLKQVTVSEPENEYDEMKNKIQIETSVLEQNNDDNNEIDDGLKERQERKKRIESIMSRLKKPNEESSSEGGGVSPRRAMSPELAEIDTEGSSVTVNPMFKSTILQSMLNKGKLSGVTKTPSPSVKEPEESKAFQDNLFNTSNNNHSTGTLPLTSLRESMEDSESLQNNANSKSSVAVRSSGIDGNSLSDANSDFIADQDNQSEPSLTNKVVLTTNREACDGQEEDSGANKDPVTNEDIKTNGVKEANNYSSVSSIETEEEEIIKHPFNQDHLYNSHIIRPMAQEGCVFQS